MPRLSPRTIMSEAVRKTKTGTSLRSLFLILRGIARPNSIKVNIKGKVPKPNKNSKAAPASGEPVDKAEPMARYTKPQGKNPLAKPIKKYENVFLED